MHSYFLLKHMWGLTYSVKSKLLKMSPNPCFLNDWHKPFIWQIAGILHRVSSGLMLPIDSDSARSNRECVPFGTNHRLKQFSHKIILFPWIPFKKESPDLPLVGEHTFCSTKNVFLVTLWTHRFNQSSRICFLLLVPLKIGEGFSLKGEAEVGLASDANVFFPGSEATRQSGCLPCSMFFAQKNCCPWHCYYNLRF